MDRRLTGERWRAAQRAALDHVLAVIADSDHVHSLVLRGSMTMPAWVGDRARDPGDLDFVVRPLATPRFDDLHPYPYVNCLDPVQHWPEAVHGAATNEIWTFEEFDTGGQHPRLPPEGTTWIDTVDVELDACRPHRDIGALVEKHPRAAGGVLVDADHTVDSNISYGYDTGYGSGGVRVTIPWHAEDAGSGSVQLDFAYDQTLPDPPVLTAIPRGTDDGRTAVWTASRELSLAWKLLWLGTDQVTRERSQGKDLYDAVLLAELSGVRPAPRLLRRVLRAVPDRDILRPASVRAWTVDWAEFRAAHPRVTGAAADWLGRLAAAIERWSG
jgi:hypothetical protein